MLHYVAYLMGGHRKGGNAGAAVYPLGKTDYACAGIVVVGKIARYLGDLYAAAVLPEHAGGHLRGGYAGR